MRQILVVLFITAPILLYGQLNLRYQRCENCPTTNSSMQVPVGGFRYNATIEEMEPSNIASDFGRRGEASRWHMGVDFSSQAGDDDVGDKFYPIESGTIVKLTGVGYKRIVVSGDHRFGYGHIFFDGVPSAGGMRSGDFLLKRMDPPLENFYAIIYTSGIELYAFGERNGTVTHPNLNNGMPITVVNQITDTNIPIAPIGDSGGTDNSDEFAAHIHLYNFQNDPVDADFNSNYPAGYNATQFRNAKNPLEFLTQERPTYIITFPATNLVYPGNDRSAFRVRAAMSGESGGGGYSSAMDIEALEFFLKSQDEPFSGFKLIKGTALESKILYGGRINTTRYPSLNNPPGNVGASAIDIAKGRIDGVDQIGTFQRTGIHPFAYGTLPYDEFYFSDFYTRIHKDDNYGGANAKFAQINDEARYKDGFYDYYVRLTTADGQFHNSAFEVLSLDNFKPYIKEVVVRKYDETGPLVYRGAWEWNGAQLKLFKENFNDAGSSDNLWIKIVSSESLKFSVAQPVAINISTVDGTVYRPMTPIEGSNNTEFVIVYEPIAVSGINQVKIQAADQADNILEKMSDSPATVPIRQANNTWAPTPNPGIDENHSFNSGTGTCGSSSPDGRISAVNCLIADFSSNVRETLPGASVIFTSQSSGQGILQYQWNFGSAASPSTANTVGPHAVTYSTLGPKTVSLTVTDQNGTLSKTKTDYIVVTQNPSSVDFTASSTSGVQPLVVNFSGISTSPVQSWSWSFPGGTPSTSTLQNPTVTYSNSGSYNVSLIINGSNTVTKTNYISVILADPLTTSILYCDNYNFTNCNNSVNQFQGLYFKSTVSGGVPPYTYSWNFGDGSTSSSIEPLHAYNSSGNFPVTSTITDSRGVTASSTLSINVGSVIPSITADFSISDVYVTVGDGPVIFTDATQSNAIDLNNAEYYWDFGEGAYPRYAYTKGPHSVCYNDWVNSKNVFLRVHDPITNKYGDKSRPNSVYVETGNVGQCYNYSSRWEPAPGAASGAAIQSCLWPNQQVGINNGGLTQVSCDMGDENIRDCVFSTTNPCFNDTWFSSHGTVSMRTEHSNSFRLYATGIFGKISEEQTENELYNWSEGIYYQHTENFIAGRRYIFTFYAAASAYDVLNNGGQSIIDHLRISLTNGLTPNTNCVNDVGNYDLPAYNFSMFRLGSFEYAVNTTAWKCYEVYFYPPNNNFNQIWIYPEVEESQIANTHSNQKMEWILLDNFSLRKTGDPNCASDLIVNDTNSAAALEASKTITTQGSVLVASGQSKEFKSGESIALKPGFTAASGSTFQAKIGPCDDVISRKRSEFDNYRIDYRDTVIKPKQYSYPVEPEGSSNIQNKISIYPNPGEDIIHIHGLWDHMQNIKVSIINLWGVEVEVFDLGQTNQIDLEVIVKDYVSGMYFVKIESGSSIHIEKIIVN